MKKFVTVFSVIVVLSLVTAFGIGEAVAATVEVSQPVQVTTSDYYERGQSIVYGGGWYWLFYGRSATETDSYQSGDPDGVADYQLYYQRAKRVAGLASAQPSSITTSFTDIFNGETSAIYFDKKVWVFASVPSPNYSGRNALYAWYSTDGTSWTEIGPFWDNKLAGSLHHDAVVFKGEVWVVEGAADGDFRTRHGDPYEPSSEAWENSQLGLGEESGGLIHFFVDRGQLYLGALRSSVPRANVIYKYNKASKSWTVIGKTSSDGWDPTLFKVGSTYVFAQSPWTNEGGGRQYTIAWSGDSLETLLSGTPKMVTEGKYGTNTWTDMWPIGFTDKAGESYLFFTSERDEPDEEGTGNIWYLKVDWDTNRDHYTYISEATDAANSGDTIMVAGGTYKEQVNLTPDKNLTLTGAGSDVVTWVAPDAEGAKCIVGAMTGYTGNMNYEISGFTFNCRSVSTVSWSAGIQINRAINGPLGLRIHDNRFIEDRQSGDTDHWATSMLLCHNRFADRDGSGNAPVHIFNNIDETWGGMTMSNSRGYDIYHNIFNGCSDAIYNGHGCPDVAGQTFGDHNIYNNIFENASDSLHPGYRTPAIDWQYHGSGGGTHLLSIIEDNLFRDNDTAIRFSMGTDMSYPAHVVTNNCFVANGVAVLVDGTYASTLNADNNWWGDVSGPYHQTSNPTGMGDEVIGSVDFDPWLDTSVCPYRNLGGCISTEIEEKCADYKGIDLRNCVHGQLGFCHEWFIFPL
jgi:hypothetical protein